MKGILTYYQGTRFGGTFRGVVQGQTGVFGTRLTFSGHMRMCGKYGCHGGSTSTYKGDHTQHARSRGLGQSMRRGDVSTSVSGIRSGASGRARGNFTITYGG